MKKLALLLWLLALGAAGLTACGGGDDQATAASETETIAAFETEGTVSVSEFGSKSCGSALFPGGPAGAVMGRVEVVEGYFPCRVARGVMKGTYRPNNPRDSTWSCHELHRSVVCKKTIKADFAQDGRG